MPPTFRWQHDYAGVPAQLNRSSVLEALRPLLEDAEKAKLGQHHAPSTTMNVLEKYAIVVRGVLFPYIMSYLKRCCPSFAFFASSVQCLEYCVLVKLLRHAR